jgi:hypothetical protein
MEGIAEYRKGNFLLLQKLQQVPKVGVKNRVTACDIKVRKSVKAAAHINAVVDYTLHLSVAYCFDFFAGVFGKYVTVFASLVTFIRNMPLKGKILLHILPPF